MGLPLAGSLLVHTALLVFLAYGSLKDLLDRDGFAPNPVAVRIVAEEELVLARRSEVEPGRGVGIADDLSPQTDLPPARAKLSAQAGAETEPTGAPPTPAPGGDGPLPVASVPTPSSEPVETALPRSAAGLRLPIGVAAQADPPAESLTPDRTVPASPRTPESPGLLASPSKSEPTAATAGENTALETPARPQPADASPGPPGPGESAKTVEEAPERVANASTPAVEAPARDNDSEEAEPAQAPGSAQVPLSGDTEAAVSAGTPATELRATTARPAAAATVPAGPRLLASETSAPGPVTPLPDGPPDAARATLAPEDAAMASALERTLVAIPAPNAASAPNETPMPAGSPGDIPLEAVAAVEARVAPRPAEPASVVGQEAGSPRAPVSALERNAVQDADTPSPTEAHSVAPHSATSAVEAPPSEDAAATAQMATAPVAAASPTMEQVAEAPSQQAAGEAAQIGRPGQRVLEPSDTDAPAAAPAEETAPPDAPRDRVGEVLASLNHLAESRSNPGKKAAGVETAIRDVLASVRCGHVEARRVRSEDAWRLDGFVPDADERSRLLSALRGLDPVRGVRAEKLGFIPRPLCQVLAPVARSGAKRAETSDRPMASAGRTRLLRPGERLDLTVTTPSFPSYLYVDYYDGKGSVHHLIPGRSRLNHYFQPGVSVQVGEGDTALRAEEGASPGLLVALASSRRLFHEHPAAVEAAAAYTQRLDAAVHRTIEGFGAKVRYTYIVVRIGG